MKQILRRFISLALCMAITLSLFLPFVFASEISDTAEGYYTVYFDNSETNWNTIYAGHGDSELISYNYAKMTRGENNIWSVQIPTSSTQVVFAEEISLSTRLYGPFPIVDGKTYVPPVSTGVVAMVGDKEYTTLGDAVRGAASGGTIVVIADFEEHSQCVISKNVNIELGGHTVRCQGISIQSGTVTISNGTLIGTTSGYSTLQTYPGLSGCFGATIKLTVNNVDVVGLRHAADIEGGDAVFNGGTFSLAASGLTHYALNIGGSFNSNVIINGSTFIGPKGIDNEGGCAMYVQKGSSAVVNDGVFKDSQLSSYTAGTLTIHGGVFDSDPTKYVSEGKVVTKDGDLWYVQTPVDVVFDSFTIAEGAPLPAFTYTTNFDSIAADGAVMDVQMAEIELQGVGEYVITADITTPGSHLYYFNITPGVLTVVAADAAVDGVGYLTLDAAVAAAEPGDTVTVLRDQVLTQTQVLDKDLTLDLNGCTVSVSGLVDSPAFRVLGNVTVGGGTVDATGGTNSYAFIVGNGETAGGLTIASGSYMGITSAVSVTRGSASILGGTFSAAHDGEGTDYGARYLLNCLDGNYPENASISVTGGSFLGFDPMDNAAEGSGTSFVAEGYCSSGSDGLWTVGKQVSAGRIIDNGRDLSLDGEVYINQYVLFEGFEGIDVTKHGGLLIWEGAVDEADATYDTADHVKAGLVRTKEDYYQQSQGIAAAQYADTYTLRVYLQLEDGSYAYGPIKVYSVRQYCENRIAKSSNEKLISACAELLHYGAAAQVVFQYNTEDPANKNILDVRPALAWDPSLLTGLDSDFTAELPVSDHVADNGRTLSLAGAVIVNSFYLVEGITVADAELMVWDGVTGALTAENVSYTSRMVHSGEEYYGQTRMFPAAELGKTVYLCGHFVDSNGNDHYSPVRAYSPEAYAASRIEKSTDAALVEAMKRMVIYGEEARKFFRKSTLQYKIGVISDAHSGYSNGTTHFAAALENLHSMGAQEIISCGDSTTLGETTQWENYLKVIAASPYTRGQIHECNGNHDGNAPALTNFLTYSNNGTLSGGKPYHAVELFGDRFLFLSLDQATTPADADCFSAEQLDWLEAELDAHYGTGKKIWIVEHANFQGWGSGDSLTAPGYPRGLNLNKASHARLQKILTAHPDCILLHGHTHIRLEDRDTHGLVVYAPPGAEQGGCHQIHVPSLTAQKHFNQAGGLVVDYSLGLSECWFCEVYDNQVVFRGINAYTGEAIPDMVYTIEF